MNPIVASRQAPQPTISAPVKAAGAVAALAILAATVSVAGAASHKAVGHAHALMNPAIVYITLPTVEVHARRHVGEPATEVACVNPHSRT